MENFFNWVTKNISKDEVISWLESNNMKYEKIDLYGDIFKSLYFIIQDTYLGDDELETKIDMSKEDKISHFKWCWDKLISDFEKEGIKIYKEGKHEKYFRNFFLDTFYDDSQKKLKIGIKNFLKDIFDVEKEFTKSDLDILTEIYKLLEKNVK